MTTGTTAGQPHRILVVGSVNLDLIVSADHLPAPGETLLGRSLDRRAGGKGGNQALAARRLGAEVELVALVGDDQDGRDATAGLRAAGVRVTNPGAVDRARDERDRAATGGTDAKDDSSVPSGVAVITVDDVGENTIVVVPGANAALTPDRLPDPLPAADALVCQLEVPIETVAAAVAAFPGLVVVNAAPAQRLPDAVVRRADVLVVNATEHEQLADQVDAAPGLVVRTLGAAGAELRRAGVPVASAGPPRVEAIDAVGAGDAFVAALTVGLLDGLQGEELLRFACAAGALATTRPGAQEAAPTRAEVHAVLGA